MSGAAVVVLVAFAPGAARAEALPAKYRPAVRAGLEWLKSKGVKDADGIRWEGSEGHYSVSMTALAGVAFLMEGSTLNEGRYRAQVRGAADWLLKRSRRDGLIADMAPRNSESSRYMFGHGFAMLFLSSLVGEEDSPARRRQLIAVLERAAKFSHQAQTKQGGWGYVSGKEGGGFDEGASTVVQLQALRAARDAGVVVPRKAIEAGRKYMELSTTTDGGVLYSLATKLRTHPALTAAAIAGGFSPGEYNSPLVKKWLKSCKDEVTTCPRRESQYEYTHYYFAQVAYGLGEDRYGKLFPKSAKGERLTWAKYREELFDVLVKAQVRAGPDKGSWPTENWAAHVVGPVYPTAVFLTVLQLDNATLPIYQR